MGVEIQHRRKGPGHRVADQGKRPIDGWGNLGRRSPVHARADHEPPGHGLSLRAEGGKRAAADITQQTAPHRRPTSGSRPRRWGRRGHLQRRHQPLRRQTSRVRRDLPGVASRWHTAVRRHRQRTPRSDRSDTRRRSVDRLNCRRAAPCGLATDAPGLRLRTGHHRSTRGHRRRRPRRSECTFLRGLRLRLPRTPHQLSSTTAVQPTAGPQQQSSQVSPRHASRPSLTASAAMARAAIGSAHHHPTVALSTRPPSRIADR